MDRSNTKMVIITNGKEEKEVTAKAASDTRSLNAHGWWVKDSVRPIAKTREVKQEIPSAEAQQTETANDQGVDVFDEQPQEEKKRPGRKANNA